MNIYLIRHTEVQIAKGTCYGQSDVLLKNIKDTDIVLKKCSSLKFDSLYSSPLSRCKILAQKISLKKGIPIQYDKRLLELNFGDWEMQSWNKISTDSYAQEWFKNYINLACPKGESYLEMITRVQDFISELKNRTEKQIGIITHAGVIKCFHHLINKKTAQEALNIHIHYGEIRHFKL